MCLITTRPTSPGNLQKSITYPIPTSLTPAASQGCRSHRSFDSNRVVTSSETRRNTKMIKSLTSRSDSRRATGTMSRRFLMERRIRSSSWWTMRHDCSKCADLATSAVFSPTAYTFKMNLAARQAYRRKYWTRIRCRNRRNRLSIIKATPWVARLT